MSSNTTLNLGSGGDVVRTLDRTSAKTQVMHLDFGGDTGAGNEQLVTSANPLPIAVSSANFIFSTGNSSTAALAAGAIFPGVIESALNQPSISLIVDNDQPLVITVRQFIDIAGANELNPIVFFLQAGQNLNRSFVLNGNYVQVKVQNVGLATTAIFNLNTAYGTIPAADGSGNSPSALYGSNEFSGLSLLEECIKGTLPLSTSIMNPEARDINGNTVLSDGPVAQRLLATTAGQAFTIDTLGYPSIHISMGTMAATITGANDLAAGTTLGSVAAFPVVLGTITSSLVASTSYIIPCVTRYIRITVTTAGWATYYLRNNTIPFGYASNPAFNLAQAGGTTLAASIANGSANKGFGASQMTAVSQVDQSATAYAGAGRVAGTVVASTQGGGGVVSAEINVSALTLGTATSVIAILQESTGGTNFTDIWTSDLITTTGIVRCPAMPIAGRRRWSFFSVGGTSTTVTVTITSLELPTGTYPLMRQFRDAFSATNPFATQINSVAQTASTLVLTTLSTATTVFNVEGCKAIAAFVTFVGGVPTTQPVLTLQLSMDGSIFWNSSATITPTAAGVFMTSLANFPGKYARLIVSTASAGGTAYTLGAVGVNAVN